MKIRYLGVSRCDNHKKVFSGEQISPCPHSFELLPPGHRSRTLSFHSARLVAQYWSKHDGGRRFYVVEDLL